ncbi:MAG TPA: 2-phospho-L-lactate guanylyltransferase [Candidatus Binatia bacterium]|jgi:2-phospho-L-lactate guanylyltransferase
MKVTALIPVKSFRNAKQRLSPLLDVAEREKLAELMFREVLAQLLRARGLAAIAVVTGDDAVARIASSFNAIVIRESQENGETAAVDFARYDLKQCGCEAILIVPGDMPLLRPSDVESLLAEIPEEADAPYALLVPSHDRLGTNALLLAPPDVIKLRFGYDSFSFHMNQLAAQGLPMRFVENERIALDIDDPKDLHKFLSYEHEDNDVKRAVKEMLANSDGKRRHSGGL